MKVFRVISWNISAMLILFIIGSGSVQAQEWDTGGWGDSGSDPWGEESEDTSAQADSVFDPGWGDDFGFGTDEKKEEEPEIIHAPYVRFVPPYDTVYELVTYEGVVNVLDADGYEVEIDTIMFRTNQWLEEEFGKKKLKNILTSNDVNPNASELEYKIIVNGKFPCIVKPNEFTQYQDGEIQFRMEIRIRDGRYRYKVNNLVHIAPVRVNEKEGIATYFEYLMKSQNDVRGGDVILKSADRKINEMIAALEKKCKTGPVLEEDEW